MANMHSEADWMIDAPLRNQTTFQTGEVATVHIGEGDIYTLKVDYMDSCNPDKLGALFIKATQFSNEGEEALMQQTVVHPQAGVVITARYKNQSLTECSFISHDRQTKDFKQLESQITEPDAGGYVCEQKLPSGWSVKMAEMDGQSFCYFINPEKQNDLIISIEKREQQVATLYVTKMNNNGDIISEMALNSSMGYIAKKTHATEHREAFYEFQDILPRGIETFGGQERIRNDLANG